MAGHVHTIFFGILLGACLSIRAACADTDFNNSHLMRGISLTNATVESESPAVIKLGTVMIPATEFELLAVVQVQTSCNYWSGTWTNETVHMSVRAGEDPDRKGYHELAREICEHWNDEYTLTNEEKGFLPQDRRVFRQGANYVLFVYPTDIRGEGFLLWIDGRIIEGTAPWSSYFPATIATFTINGVRIDLEEKTLPPHKILSLFKRGAFGVRK